MPADEPLAMQPGRYFNPDDHLETQAGRVFTPQRNAIAFERAYSELRQALRSARPGATLFVVIGVQGAGKTTWIRQHAAQLGPDAYFFDAALPRAVHRARALTVARECDVPASAVWIDTPLDMALARNQQRRADHRVPEAAIRSVHAMLEPPSTAEGFAHVRQVRT